MDGNTVISFFVAGEKLGIATQIKDGLMSRKFYKYIPQYLIATSELNYIKLSSFGESSKTIMRIIIASNGKSDFRECIVSVDRHTTTQQTILCSIKNVIGYIKAFSNIDSIYIKREAYNTAILSIIGGNDDIPVSIVKELPSDAKPVRELGV